MIATPTFPDLAALVVQAIWLLPAFTGPAYDGSWRQRPDGPRISVATANLYLARADPRAVAALDTPRDLDTLSVSDIGGSTGVRRCEETEVVERVHCVRQGSAFDVPGLSNNRRQWVVETLTVDVLAH